MGTASLSTGPAREASSKDCTERVEQQRRAEPMGDPDEAMALPPIDDNPIKSAPADPAPAN